MNAPLVDRDLVDGVTSQHPLTLPIMTVPMKMSATNRVFFFPLTGRVGLASSDDRFWNRIDHFFRFFSYRPTGRTEQHAAVESGHRLRADAVAHVRGQRLAVVAGRHGAPGEARAIRVTFFTFFSARSRRPSGPLFHSTITFDFVCVRRFYF